MRPLLAVAIAGVLAIAAPIAQERGKQAEPKAAELRQKLEATLARTAASLDGVMGYAIVDLTSGDRIEKMPDEVFPTASTIKLAILYELFRQADEGKVRLGEMKPFDPRTGVGGTGILTQLSAPSLPLRDYATLMIVLSDNSATNVLIDLLGMSNVTTRMASLGLKDTKLRRRMIDAAAARRGDENVSTPGEIARLLEILNRGEGLSKAAHDELLAILKKPRNSPLRRGVPAGIPIASKSGTLEAVHVDAGVVYLPGRPYVFSAMTSYVRVESEGEEAIAAASRAAFEYFSRVARSSEYGRIIR